MSERAEPAAAGRPDADASAHVGGLRILVVRPNGAEGVAELIARIDCYVQMYLEQNWTPPRRRKRIKELCYALFSADDSELDRDELEHIRQTIEDRLFGAGDHGVVQVLSLVSDLDGVTDWMETPDEAALDQAGASDDARARRPRIGAFTPYEPLDDPDSSCLDHAAPIDGFGIAGRAPALAPARRRMRSFTGDLTKDLGFQAVFALKNAAVFCSEIVLRPARGAARARPLGALLHTSREAFEDAELDAIRFAELCFAQRRPDEDGACFILAPVSYETLGHPRKRARYLDLLADLDYGLQDSLVISILETPELPDPYAARLIADHVRPYARFIDWRIARGVVDAERLRHIGAHSITFDPHLSATGGEIERARFASALPGMRRFGLNAGVAGVRTQEQLDDALAREVAYAAGPAVSGCFAMPLTVARVAYEELPIAAP
ncbi:MAG: hypothetical protein MI723_01925 [Caulobacterales bacterium]|nr:hypothetical protein [Caulobacterales bacterium]